MVTGPVKLAGLRMVSRLDPCLTRLPAPLMLPELLKVKLLALELTLMTLGETVPLIVTRFETPTVSSNNTWSLEVKFVCMLLLSQLNELPVSHTPLAPPEFHLRELPDASKVRLAETLLVVPLPL